MEKISIIVPVYKVEAYLRRCIDSILEQEYNNFELILIDDGSPDQCGIICDEYARKDDRVKVIHQENKGVSVARNRGLEAATGDYIGFVDSDDVIEPDLFSFLLKNAKEHNAEISACATTIKFADGKEKYMYGTEKIYDIDSVHAAELLLKGGIIDSAVYDKLFKKESVSQVRFAQGIRMQEDRLFILQAFSNSKRVYINDIPKYIRYERCDSATAGDFHPRWFDINIVVDKMYDIAVGMSDTLKDVAVYNLVKSKIFLYRKVIRNGADKKYNSETQKLKQDICKFDLKSIKKFASLKEKVEFLIIRKASFLYSLFLKIFDITIR